MVNKIVRKKLLEEKKKRDNRLVETTLVESRLKVIVESKSKCRSLSEEKQKKVFIQVLKEINVLESQGLINEEFKFTDILDKLFGQGWSVLGQAIVEPMIDSIFGWFNMKGPFAKFVSSFIASDPRRLANALSDCRELTKLVAESLAEALVRTMMQSKGMDGTGYGIIRNLLGGAIKDTEFIKGLEKQMSDGVCKLFGSFTDKAENVLNKVQAKPAVA